VKTFSEGGEWSKVLRKLLEWLGLVEPKDEEWQEPQGELVIRPMTYADLDDVARLEKNVLWLGRMVKGCLCFGTQART
jgi:hypothetical protein